MAEPTVIEKRLTLGPIHGTYTAPLAAEGTPTATALLLHGTGSNRDEVHNAYGILAGALASNGVASLRIDLPGCGEDASPEIAYTINAQHDYATTALAWLRAQHRTAITTALGFSQGGVIAALLASDEAVDRAVLWSSGDLVATHVPQQFANAFTGNLPSATIDLGFRTFEFSRTWFNEFSTVDISARIAGFAGDILTINGGRDNVVPAKAAELFRTAATNARSATGVILQDGDHIFTTTTGASLIDAVIAQTVEWLTTRNDESTRARSIVFDSPNAVNSENGTNNVPNL